MLRWLSKAGLLIQLLMLMLIAGLAWFPSFSKPGPPILMPTQGPLYGFLLSLIRGNAVYSTVLSAVIILFASVIANFSLKAHNLISRESFLLPLVIVATLSWHPDLLRLNPVICTLPFLIVSMVMLFSIYNHPDPHRLALSAGISVGLASLFYYPAVIFLFFCWSALLTLRISSWREWVIVLIGIILPLIYFISGLYLTDRFEVFYREASEIRVLAFADTGKLAGLDLIWIILLLSVQLFIFLTVLPALYDKLISVRRKAWIIADLAIISMVFFLVIAEMQHLFTYFLGLTVSAFIVIALTTRRWAAFYDYFGMLMIIASFVAQLIARL